MDSTYDKTDHQVTAALTHLSWYAPVVVDRGRLVSQLTSWIGQAAGMKTNPPDCYSDKSSDLKITGLTEDVVWPCATSAIHGTDWSIQSNDGLVWQILTDPDTTYRPVTASTLSNAATAALFNIIKPALKGKNVMLPGETLAGHFEAEPPYTVALKVEPGLSQVASILWGLGMIFPNKWLDLADKGECILGVVNSGTSAPSGESLRSILSCVATLMKGAGAAILGIILTGPALLVAQLEGAAREIAHTNAVQFTIAAKDPNKVNSIPTSAQWLFQMGGSLLDEVVRDNPTITANGVTNSYPNSTKIFVGCGTDSYGSSIYMRSDAYTKVSFALALNNDVPSDYSLTLSLGGSSSLGAFGTLPEVTYGTWTLHPGEIIPRQTVDFTGMWALTITATPSVPLCGDLPVAVADFLDAYVQ
ncbi:hypothetical protein ASF88_01855 [Leifsonia sp. Leaf336]|nr:hypothetical protein ASF88_01855 [Leifsonia sp. Leaf336]